MEKALEILTFMKASINGEEETHEKLYNMSDSELHQYLNEAIAELEEDMKPKTCDGCKHRGHLHESLTNKITNGFCVENGFFTKHGFCCNRHEPKEK